MTNFSRTFVRWTICCILSCFVGCHADESSDAPASFEQRALTDGEIAHIVRTINRGQIEQAELALVRLKRRYDRSFAEQLIVDHEKSNDTIGVLTDKPELEPEDNSISVQLQSESDRTLATLREASDDLIDLAYVDAQVTAYGKLVALFEKQLLIDARNPELVSFLETERKRVREKFVRAQELDAELDP